MMYLLNFDQVHSGLRFFNLGFLFLIHKLFLQMSSALVYIETALDTYHQFYQLPSDIFSKFKILLTENVVNFDTDIFMQLLIELLITLTPPEFLLEGMFVKFGPLAWSLEMLLFLRYIMSVYNPDKLADSILLYSMLVDFSL